MYLSYIVDYEWYIGFKWNYLPKNVWIKPFKEQDISLSNVPWLILPMRSNGIATKEIASSLKIRLMSMKFCSVFLFWNKHDAIESNQGWLYTEHFSN